MLVRDRLEVRMGFQPLADLGKGLRSLCLRLFGIRKLLLLRLKRLPGCFELVFGFQNLLPGLIKFHIEFARRFDGRLPGRALGLGTGKVFFGLFRPAAGCVKALAGCGMPRCGFSNLSRCLPLLPVGRQVVFVQGTQPMGLIKAGKVRTLAFGFMTRLKSRVMIGLCLLESGFQCIVPVIPLPRLLVAAALPFKFPAPRFKLLPFSFELMAFVIGKGIEVARLLFQRFQRFLFAFGPLMGGYGKCRVEPGIGHGFKQAGAFFGAGFEKGREVALRQQDRPAELLVAQTNFLTDELEGFFLAVFGFADAVSR
jgi:hypothetical protein